MGLRTLLRNGAALSPALSISSALFLSPRGWYPPPPSLWPLVLRSQCPLCCAVSRICSSPPSYAPYASRMDLRDAPRNASIPSALTRLRILPVTTAVAPRLHSPSMPSPSQCPLCRRLPRPGRGGKSHVFSSLPPLCRSLRSFSHSLPLFSRACSLFSQNTPGVGGQRLKAAPKKQKPRLATGPLT